MRGSAGGGIEVSNKPLSGPAVVFADVVLVDTARIDQRFGWVHPHEEANANGTHTCKWCHIAPIFWQDSAGGLGGLWLENVTVIDSENRPFLRYYRSACAGAKCPNAVGDIRGSVLVSWSASSLQCNASLMDQDNGTNLGDELLQNVSVGCVETSRLKNDDDAAISLSRDCGTEAPSQQSLIAEAKIPRLKHDDADGDERSHRIASGPSPCDGPSPCATTRPALSHYGYSTRESDLEFFKSNQPSSSATNSSWLDFFLGVETVVCRAAPAGQCDPIRETAKAAEFLGIPALFPVRSAFFADSHGSATVPSLGDAERSWTALKQRLPNSTANLVLGFFLGDELHVTNASSYPATRIRWAVRHFCRYTVLISSDETVHCRGFFSYGNFLSAVVCVIAGGSNS